MGYHSFQLTGFAIEAGQLVVHGQQTFDKFLFGLSVFLDDHADIAAGVERVVLLFHIFRSGQFAQAGDVFVLGGGKTLLQPVDMLEVVFRTFYFSMQFFQSSF
ncbi:hypothetical protein D9M71_707660 [compost metagenome]